MENVRCSLTNLSKALASATLGLKKLNLGIFLFLLFMVLTNLPLRAWSAACCGGAAQIPALITAEDQRQWTTTFSQEDVFAQVDENGYWYPRSNHLYQQVLKIDYAQMLSSNWQVGFDLPVQNTNDQNKDSSGYLTGDSTLTFGYRAIDENFIGSWHPQVLTFASFTFPTGRSYYESTDPLKLDVTGKGFYQPSVGVMLLRTAGDVDAQAIFEIHHGLPRSFSNELGNLTYTPGFGGSVTFGAGYNRGRWRYGASLIQLYEDPVLVSQQTPTSVESVATTSLTASYLFPNLFTATLSYSNQEWFGNPISTTLGQTWALALQKRWPRE